MNSRFFIGLLFGVVVTSLVVIFVNYHDMFSMSDINKQSQLIQQSGASQDSSDAVMMLTPNVKMKVVKSKLDASGAEVDVHKQLKSKGDASDILAEIADDMKDSSSIVATIPQAETRQVTITIAKYNTLEEADSMVDKLTMLGFSPIIDHNHNDYEVVLIVASSQEQKLLEQELRKDNIDFIETT